MENLLNSRIRKEVEEIFPSIVEIRRTLHQHPELSGHEYKTARFVHSTLGKLGLKPQFHLKDTAVSINLRNGKGKTVVLRADMDALPVTEKNNIPFKSKNSGVMHACGHDMHTAILLGAASILWKLRAEWRGKLVCLFQPSEEEEPGGAYGLIKAGVFPKDASAVFGLHVSADHRSGQIGLKEGSDYAGVITFDVMVKGKGGHGATPEKTVDPIVCASSMIISLQTLISRECAPYESAVLTVGSIHAGIRRNIIPDTAFFQGTIRTHKTEIGEFLISRISECLKSLAAAFRASVEIDFNRSYPPGYNDPELTSRTEKVFQNYFGALKIIRRPYATMYAEDFSRFQERAPGLYVHLGVRPPNRKKMDGIHTSRFLPDESAMKAGMAAHLLFALNNLL